MKIILWFVLTAFTFSFIESKRILVVAPYKGKSHAAIIQPIVLELVRRGHNVTMITSNPIKDAPNTLHQIVLSQNTVFGSVISAQGSEQHLIFQFGRFPVLIIVFHLLNFALNVAKEQMSSRVMQDFIKNDNSTFDLVISEYIYQEAFYGFAHKYRTPLVLFGCQTYWSSVEDMMGLPSTISYLSRELSRSAGDLTLTQRVSNYLSYAFHRFMQKYFIRPQHDALIRENFGTNAPTVNELEKNVSLVMFNTHYSFDPVRPLVPGVIEIAGVHLKPPETLPKDLQSFLDGADEGFVFFSLGSRLNTTAIPLSVIDAFIKSFGKLKQRVIWKWDDKTAPPVPENILMSNWFPQSSVLAHPNIRVFITHAGILSMIEAVNYGVPMIGIPICNDQFLNVDKLELIGIGKKLNYFELSEDTISDSLDQVLNNPKYAMAAKDVSLSFNDRMSTPVETAAYWIEYVIRHKGAKFMKSKLIDVPWYEYHLLDVYAVLLLIACITSIAIIKCFLFTTKIGRRVINKLKKD